MENTGEVMSAGVVSTVGTLSAPNQDVFEPKLDFQESAFEPGIVEEVGVGDHMVQEIGVDEDTSQNVDLGAEQDESVGGPLPEELSDIDIEKIENIRELMSREIESKINSEIEDSDLVTREEIAYMLILALMLLKEEQRRGEKSFFEVMISVIGMLIKDMFEPEKMGEPRGQMERPLKRANSDNMKSLRDVFSIRQRNKSSFNLEKAAA